jgi:hypothetical protein
MDRLAERVLEDLREAIGRVETVEGHYGQQTANDQDHRFRSKGMQHGNNIALLHWLESVHHEETRVNDDQCCSRLKIFNSCACVNADIYANLGLSCRIYCNRSTGALFSMYKDNHLPYYL